MTNVRARAPYIILIAAALLILMFNIWFFKPSLPGGPPNPSGFPATLPDEGFSLSDTKGEIPGHPEVAEQQLKDLYRQMTIYKARHGKLPVLNPRDFTFANDVGSNFKEYGIVTEADVKAYMNANLNSDMQYREGDRNANLHTQFYVGVWKRPDGAELYATKKPGTRDVIAWSDMYYHRNIRYFKGDISKENPVGFYLVLWEDGEVTRVPWQQVRHTTSGAQLSPFFVGQAGEPASGSLSNEQFKQWGHDIATGKKP